MADRDHPPAHRTTSTGAAAGTTGDTERTSIPRPADEQVVYRADAHDDVVGTSRRRFDLPATLGGALAALGTLVLLSALVSAAVGTIGYQTDVEGRDLSIGGLVAGLVVLFLACLVGGWVAGRMARHRGGLHGLVAILWLVLLAAVVAALAAIFGDDLDVTDQLSLPDWFSRDALTTGAIITGVVALLLALLGGWLGGRLGARHHADEQVALVATRRAVHERAGGITAGPGATTGTTTGTSTGTTRTGRTTR